MRLGFSGFIYLVILLSSIRFRIAVGVSKTSSEAYVSLLYGDEFLLGVRVLGKSIRDTGTTKDMVVLVSDGVSDYAKKLLQADGWIVQTISLLANPNQVRPKRFWGVYTKLKIFNLTDYKKVVYLDADTVVLKSIEDLFECRKFCANLKHSERLNSGVMVVEPSETVFNDMMNKVNTLYSYTGGDQGFLNSYFAGFANAHIFDPKLSSDVMNSRPVEMERLSTLYNADVGLYMLANKWMVDEKELRVVHYTLGPLKPWDWWTAWLLNPVDLWQNVRIQLEESLPGTGGGRNPRDIILVKFLFLLPIFVLLLISNRCFLLRRKDFFGVFCRGFLFGQIIKLYYKHRGGAGLSYSYSTVGVSSSSVTDSNQMFSIGIQSKVPTYLVGVSVFTCFISAVVSLALAFAAVPRQVMPWTGLLLLYEWTFTIFFILFGSYLRLIHQWGKMMAAQAGYYPAHRDSSDNDDRKGHQRQASSVDVATLYYGFGMALLAVAAPSLPCILGITALFPRLGLMVVGGIVLASFMTYASERLAIRAFLRGLEDRRDMPRTRNSCIC